MRGLPGSGKSTVARQLAGEHGVIFSLDKQIMPQTKTLIHEETSLRDLYDKTFHNFCEEIKKGTEIIVIDNTNLSEWEYVRFIKKAQLEHYFVSVVAVAPPQDIQTIKERTQFDVNDNELTQLFSKWEPYSPSRLTEKSHSFHEPKEAQHHREKDRKSFQNNIIVETN